MKILENGDAIMNDGTLIPADQLGKQYLKAPRSAESLESEATEESKQLQEGQSSGPMRLED